MIGRVFRVLCVCPFVIARRKRRLLSADPACLVLVVLMFRIECVQFRDDGKQFLVRAREYVFERECVDNADGICRCIVAAR